MALLPDRIEGDTIELRRWNPDMVDEMLAAVTSSAQELRRWMPWAQEVANRESTLAVLREGQRRFDDNEMWDYAVVEISSGDLVGAAGLDQVDDPDCPEIGYWVRSDRTGRGYATAAVKALVEAAFLALVEIDHVKIRMDQANVASAAIPPKLDFSLVAEELREIEIEGHTGRGFIWILGRRHADVP